MKAPTFYRKYSCITKKNISKVFLFNYLLTIVLKYTSVLFFALVIDGKKNFVRIIKMVYI